MTDFDVKPLLVLISLAERPRYGSELQEWIRSTTGGRVELSDGATYPLLRRLVDAGWLERSTGRSANNRNATFVALTDQGRRQLRWSIVRWREICAAVDPALDERRG